MPYTETHEEAFTYFEDWEGTAIEEWLKARNKTWGFPTLCGSCCGFWNAEYWVSLSPTEVWSFNEFAREKGIGAKAHSGGICIP